MYAQKLVDELKEAGLSLRILTCSHSHLDDVKYWVNETPKFGKRKLFTLMTVFTSSGLVAPVET
ncbi:hypothetical protein O9992_25160 [Vibrio lentus]|nr:hypothetical protein [Vibrio lentus]